MPSSSCGRAGQQNQQAALAFVGGFEPLAGSGAAAVLEQFGSGNAVGLLDVVFRHAHAIGGGAGVHGGHHLMVALQLHAKSLGHALARKIVLGGAEASGKNNDLGARERDAAGLQQMLAAVADDGLEDDLDAKFIEPPGKEQGIGVLAEGRQELGADRYDLSIHA